MSDTPQKRVREQLTLKLGYELNRDLEKRLEYLGCTKNAYIIAAIEDRLKRECEK